jgi:hypothetical protein
VTSFSEVSSLPYVLHAPPTHPSRLITRKVLGEHYRSLNSFMYSFLYSSVTPSLLNPYIYIYIYSTLFPNTLSLRSSLNLSDHVSHPYKKKPRKIIVLYILTFKFLDNKLEDKTFCTE